LLHHVSLITIPHSFLFCKPYFRFFLHFLRKRQPLPYCAASNSCRISRHRAASGTMPVK